MSKLITAKIVVAEAKISEIKTRGYGDKNRESAHYCRDKAQTWVDKANEHDKMAEKQDLRDQVAVEHLEGQIAVLKGKLPRQESVA